MLKEDVVESKDDKTAKLLDVLAHATEKGHLKWKRDCFKDAEYHVELRSVKVYVDRCDGVNGVKYGFQIYDCEEYSTLLSINDADHIVDLFNAAKNSVAASNKKAIDQIISEVESLKILE